jgi:transposase
VGFDGHKKVKGRKRHILVDTLGLIIAVVVTAANHDDRQGLVALLTTYFVSGITRLRKIWVDEGYEAQWLREWARSLKQTHKIDVEVVERTGKGVEVVKQRWKVEVTFEEARAHLGLETPRQWNDRAIARTTPALLSLYTLVTLVAHLLIVKGATCVRRTAWYRKTCPTFAEALALVRRHVWEHLHFSMSPQEIDMIKIPRALCERFTEALYYAA